MNRSVILLFISFIIIFSGCKKAFFEPEPQNNPEALFENLWGTFNTDYAPFEERGINWDSIYSIYRPMVHQNTTEEELYTIFKNMLRTLNDGHVNLTIPDHEVFVSNSILDEKIDNGLFNLELIKSNYLTGDFTETTDGFIVYGWIGTIGYVHLGDVGTSWMVMNSILDYFINADGLILDLRHNEGGDFTYAFSELGRFTDQVRYVFQSKTKNGQGKDDFTGWTKWEVSPSGSYFNKDLVIITDRYTFSAGERATMAFKTLPNVIHIGDTTNGAQSTKIGKELANGWYYSIATQKVEFADGNSYEGIGLIPDIFIKNTLSEINLGQDKTLEKAIDQFNHQ